MENNVKNNQVSDRQQIQIAIKDAENGIDMTNKLIEFRMTQPDSKARQHSLKFLQSLIKDYTRKIDKLNNNDRIR